MNRGFKKGILFSLAIILAGSLILSAQNTDIRYLSGTGFDQTDNLGPQSRAYEYNPKWVKDGALQIELTFDFSQKN